MSGDKKFKEYVLCEEIVNGEHYTGFFTIRANTDCSPSRFDIIDSFDTYEDALEAEHFFRGLRDAKRMVKNNK